MHEKIIDNKETGYYNICQQILDVKKIYHHIHKQQHSKAARKHNRIISPQTRDKGTLLFIESVEPVKIIPNDIHEEKSHESSEKVMKMNQV